MSEIMIDYLLMTPLALTTSYHTSSFDQQTILCVESGRDNLILIIMRRVHL